jgi:hypothetical protein
MNRTNDSEFILSIRQIWNQEEERVRDYILVSFLAYIPEINYRG